LGTPGNVRREDRDGLNVDDDALPGNDRHTPTTRNDLEPARYLGWPKTSALSLDEWDMAQVTAQDTAQDSVPQVRKGYPKGLS